MTKRWMRISPSPRKEGFSSISLSAEERYAELITTYPEFLQRFPQHIIASTWA